MKLEGKVAVITGAGSGMGRAMSLLFGGEGARVVAVDWAGDSAEETARLVEAEGKGRAVAVKADVSQVADVDRMIGTAVERFGGVDIPCNNAGVLDLRPAAEVDDASWDRVINVNLKGVFLGCRRAIPEMLKHGRGGRFRLHRLKARRHRHHESPGLCLRFPGHPGQRHLPGGHRDRHDPGHAQGSGDAPVASVDTARAHRPAGGHRPRGAVPRLRRLELRHRRSAGGRRRVDGALRVERSGSA